MCLWKEYGIMLLQWSAPEYVPRSFLVSGVSGTNKAVKQTDTSFRLTKQVADGLVDMQEVSKDYFSAVWNGVQKETELCEEYPERKVFQLSFCMNGICEWDYRQNEASTTSFPLHSAAYSVELFPMRQPFWFWRTLPNIKHFAGTGAFPAFGRGFRSCAFNSAG